MTDILSRIDAATEGLCACGCGQKLDPDGPSAWFATADCQRSWNERRTADPDQVRGSQTVAADQMRWRPDLVSAAPDEHLRQHGDPSRVGTFTVTLFERTDRHAAHVRVDDGYRFAGRDVELGGTDEEIEARTSAAVEACQRELADPRGLAEDECQEVFEFATWIDEAWDEVVQWGAREGIFVYDGQPVEAPASIRVAWTPGIVTAVNLTPPVPHVIEARRTRNTGPARSPRAPRRIDPRGGHR